MPDTSSLPHVIAHSFDEALSHDLIHLYAYDSTHAVPLAPSDDDEQGERGPRHFVHVVPGLAKKPAVPLHTPDLTRVTKRDPFQGPEFGPGEKILDLESQLDGSTYSLVHNLHALMREHFMAIPHFDARHPFRPQTSLLVPSDFEIAWRVVSSYSESATSPQDNDDDDGDDKKTTTTTTRRRESRLICFFNGGPAAGASQPHLHMQFCPFQHGVAPLVQHVADEMTRRSRGEWRWRRGRPVDEQDVRRLDRLPWQVWCVPLPRSTTVGSRTNPSEEEEEDDEEEEEEDKVDPLVLHELYLHLFSTAQRHLPPRPSEDRGRSDFLGTTSHNVFLTSTHLFVVPRRHRMTTVPRSASIEQGHLSLGGGWEDVEGAEREMRLSVNGLTMLGYWYVGSREEMDDLERYGLERALRECGYE
ncbi:hypothetical protein JCM10212_002753 [Sporobolomyces blumeae]